MPPSDQKHDQEFDIDPGCGCGCGCLTIIIAIISYTVLSNAFTFETWSRYGFSQYVQNIISLESGDETLLIHGKRKVFKKNIPASKLNTTLPMDILADHTTVRIIGTQDLEYLTWLAVSYYKKDKEMWGFIIKNVRDESPITDLKDIEDKIEDALVSKWIRAEKAKQTKDKTEMQMVVESSKYKPILKCTDSLVYCSKSDHSSYRMELEESQHQAPYILYQNGNHSLWNLPVRGYDFRYSNPLQSKEQ